VLQGAGISKETSQVLPEACVINLVPLMSLPKLVVQGRYDELRPIKTVFNPLYQLLPEPKTSAVYDGAHVADDDYFVRTVNEFLSQLDPIKLRSAIAEPGAEP
jgi:hypothetical protein